MGENEQTPAEVAPAAKAKPKAAAKKPAAPAPAPVPPVLPRELELLRGAPMPVRSYEDALRHFRRPFTPAAVKWKVQTEWGSGALIVAYIDARLVYERINLVYPWVDEEKIALGQGVTRCNLLVKDPITREVIVTKTDVGSGGDAKTVESDAIKRAAVHLGIGVSIYALAQVRMKVGPADGELRTEKRRKKGEQGKVDVPTIDKRTAGWLTWMYEAWLQRFGEVKFGPALDHGDEYGSQGLDLDSPDAAAEVEGGDPEGEQLPATEQIAGERAEELRGICEGLYGQWKKAAPGKVRSFTPAAFQAKLQEAGATSLEALEAFETELKDMVRAAGGDAS